MYVCFRAGYSKVTRGEHKHANLGEAAYQMWDNSKIGSFDFVKNSFAAEPVKKKNSYPNKYEGIL